MVKLAHHELGDNYGDTFRVENGLIRVMYDKYTDFGARFGHLFYKQKLSHYVVSVEYRFFGEQAKGGPSYARLNSGVMVHSQAPETILKDQDWPISVEAQLLAGNRTTMNVCTPGTEIFMHGEMVKAHCTNSTSKIYADDEWVKVEVEVLGSEHVRHLIDGADCARIREADDRRRSGQRLRSGDQEGRHDPRGRLHGAAGREPAGRVQERAAAEPLGLHGPVVARVSRVLRAPG